DDPPRGPATGRPGALAHSRGTSDMRRRQLALAALVAVTCAAMFTGCSCGTSTVAPPTPPLSAVIVSPTLDTLVVGAQRQFTAVALDTDSVAVSGVAVSWRSGDPNVVSVSSSGLAQGVGEGVTTIIASAGGRADTAVVAVFVQAGWYVQTSSTTNELYGVYFR